MFCLGECDGSFEKRKWKGNTLRKIYLIMNDLIFNVLIRLGF